jgi:hypothetical protein
VKTEHEIRAFLASRTTACGDCLLWTMATNSAGAPVASIEGVRSRPARRWVWESLNGPAGTKRLMPTCGRPLCLEPSHQTALEPSDINRAIAARGGFQTPAFRRARREAGRARGKLTLADARMIRHRRLVQGETLVAIRRDYPVSLSVLSHICRGEAWPDPQGNPFEGLMR